MSNPIILIPKGYTISYLDALNALRYKKGILEYSLDGSLENIVVLKAVDFKVNPRADAVVIFASALAETSLQLGNFNLSDWDEPEGR